MSPKVFITEDGVILSGGNGIKRTNNINIWRLWDMGYCKHEITEVLFLHRNTIYRHIVIYGRMRAT